MESYNPIEAPEIREPEEKYRGIEFWVHLGESRPDIRLFELVLDWIKNEPPCVIAGLQISYHRATDEEPDLLCGVLFVGDPIDIG